MTEPPEQRRRAEGRRAVVAGVALLAFFTVLGAVPLIWVRSAINKYFVAIGFFGACAALSLILHGAWDWWRAWRRS